MSLAIRCLTVIAVLSALVTSAGAQTTLPPGRPIAKWDKLSNEIIPKVVEMNGDMGGMVKFFKKATCSIEFSFLTSESRNPITGTMSFYMDDANQNGILTVDEVEVDVKSVSQPLFGYAMKGIRQGIRDQVCTSTFNFFGLCDTKAITKDGGYVMELRPVEGGRVTPLLAFEKLWLTVSPDFRVTHVQTRTIDMLEVSIDVKHVKVGEVTLRGGHVQTVEKPSGEKFVDDRTDTWGSVAGVPVITRVVLDSQVTVITGTITTRQVFDFTNWEVEKREKPLPIPGTKDYEAMFRGRLTDDTPLVEREGDGAPPPPPGPTPGGTGGGGTGGGVFEDDPPPGGTGTGGGVFEDDPPPGGADAAAARLGAEVLGKVGAAYYGFGRYAGKAYTAKAVLGATPEQVAAEVTVTTADGPSVDRIADATAYDMQAAFYGIRYGWGLAMDGPLFRPIDPPASWRAKADAGGFLLEALDAAGAVLEEVKVAADGTVRERTALVRQEEGQARVRFRITFETSVAENLKFVMKASVTQDVPPNLPVDSRTFVYAWKHVGDVPFLKRLIVETLKDGRAVSAPLHVTTVEIE